MRLRLSILIFALIMTLGLILMPQGVRSQGNDQTATYVAMQSCQIDIIRDDESLTIYIAGNRCVSLAGLAFEVEVNGQVRSYPLDSYTSFKGLPFTRLPVPICLRLQVQGSKLGFPNDCLQLLTNRRLKHEVQNADVFWYDPDAGQGILLNVLRYGEFIDICPAGQPRCPLLLPPAPPTPTPLPTNTPDPQAIIATPMATNTEPPLAMATVATKGYPCAASIITTGASVMNIVREFPAGGNRSSVSAGQVVLVIGKTPNSASEPLYKIRDAKSGRDLGWIPVEYVVLTESCLT